MGNYLIPETLPFAHCPGCSHPTVFKALSAALDKANIPNTKIVIVSDIGCVGIADKYFNVNTFHGLHGRSITYATGIKLANPELKVIVLIGDGGCGIGGTHLLNAARRNIGITVLLFNNFNFGMTGGQHSVTTPFEGVTTTTFKGNIERSMDICGALATGCKPSFIARVFASDKILTDIIYQAIVTPGFSLVDIWELCAAYYGPKNKLNLQKLKGLLEEGNFSYGIIHQNNCEEYTSLYRKKYWQSSGNEDANEKIQMEGIAPKFTSVLTKKTSIILAGKAGQKIISTASIFGKAGLLCNLFVTQKNDFPITVMTGHSISEIILSPEEIYFTEIKEPDFLIVVANEGLKYISKKLKIFSEKTIIFADSQLDMPETSAKIIRIPFVKEASKISQTVIPLTALSTLLTYSKIFPIEALKESVVSTETKGNTEEMLKAIELGQKLLVYS